MGVLITWTLPSGALQTLTLDAAVREQHDATATPTDHPIEESPDASDGVHRELDRVSLDVRVTNHPAETPPDHADGVTGQVGSVDFPSQPGGPATKATVMKFDGEFDRPRNVYERLLELMNAGTRLSIFTSIREYSNMVLTRVAPTREARTGSAFAGIVDAREMRIVSSLIVDAPDPTTARGNRRSQRGRRPTEQANPQTEERNETVARWGFRTIGEAFTGGD